MPGYGYVLGLKAFALEETGDYGAAEATVLERDRAGVATDFLASIFETNDPNQAQGGMLTAREILANGADRIETELAGQTQMQVYLFNVIGEIYQNLGLYDEAIALEPQPENGEPLGGAPTGHDGQLPRGAVDRGRRRCRRTEARVLQHLRGPRALRPALSPRRL